MSKIMIQTGVQFTLNTSQGQVVLNDTCSEWVVLANGTLVLKNVAHTTIAPGVWRSIERTFVEETR